MDSGVLKYLAEKAISCDKACRIMVEPLGIRINMWVRHDGLYADRNHMIGWTEIEYLDPKTVDMIFEHLNFFIDQRIRKAIRIRDGHEPGPVVSAYLATRKGEENGN